METAQPQTDKLELLKNGRGLCEEASPSSKDEYIPCAAPAVALVKTRDQEPYLMCFGCADHNVRHRRANIIFRFQPPDESKSLLEEATSIKVIVSGEQYSRVAMLRGLIKDMVKKVTADAKPSIDEANQHVKNLRARLAQKVDPLEAQYRSLGGLLLNYDSEQERIRKQKQLELEAEERRKREQEQRELAELAEQVGGKELAEEIKREPIQTGPVVVEKETPTAKETGVSFREDWVNFQLADLAKVPIEYHLLDEVKVRKIVRALKEQTNIPGIKVLPPTKVPIQR